jgi:uncharacterized protein
MPDETPTIDDNEQKRRYEIVIGDQISFLDYRRRDGSVILVHTEVPESLRGQGLGQRLARHALDEARRNGLEVIVKCPFLTTWLKRHKEYDDIVVSRVHETGEVERYTPPTGPK